MMLYHCKDPKKPRSLLLEPAGISIVNISVTTTHSGLGIKPGTKLLGLNNKSKATLRNRLPEVKLLLIIINLLWYQVIPEIGFAGLSAMSEADMLQLTPVSGKLIFSEISDKGSM